MKKGLIVFLIMFMASSVLAGGPPSKPSQWEEKETQDTIQLIGDDDTLLVFKDSAALTLVYLGNNDTLSFQNMMMKLLNSAATASFLIEQTSSGAAQLQLKSVDGTDSMYFSIYTDQDDSAVIFYDEIQAAEICRFVYGKGVYIGEEVADSMAATRAYADMAAGAGLWTEPSDLLLYWFPLTSDTAVGITRDTCTTAADTTTMAAEDVFILEADSGVIIRGTTGDGNYIDLEDSVLFGTKAFIGVVHSDSEVVTKYYVDETVTTSGDAAEVDTGSAQVVALGSPFVLCEGFGGDLAEGGDSVYVGVDTTEIADRDSVLRKSGGMMTGTLNMDSYDLGRVNKVYGNLGGDPIEFHVTSGSIRIIGGTPVDTCQLYPSGLTKGGYTGDAIADEYIDNDITIDHADSATHLTDGTVDAADIATGAVTTTEILDGTIAEADLNATNTPGPSEDDYVLSYNDAGGNFTWVVNAGGGGEYNLFDTLNSNDTLVYVNGTDTVLKVITDSAGNTYVDGDGDDTLHVGVNSDRLIAGPVGLTESDSLDADLLRVNSVYTFPVVDGSANQVIKTDGSGALSWTDQGAGSGDTITVDTGNGTPVDVYHPIFVEGSGIDLEIHPTDADSISIAATLGASVDLAAEVTGTLPEANGGTGDTDLDDIVAGHSIAVTDGANTIIAGNATIAVDTGNAVADAETKVVSGNAIYDYLVAGYQPLEATLTDIADGTINENLVNTANPWADNEVANDITASNYVELDGDTMSGALRATDIHAEGNMAINVDSGNNVSYLFFYDDDEVVDLRWVDSLDRFELTDDISVTGNIVLSGTVDTVDVAALGATVPKITDDTTNFKAAYDSVGVWDNRGYPDATVADQGIASFADADFTVTTGAVTIDDKFLLNGANDATTGTLTATGFIIGSADIAEAELEIIDGATVTTTELNYVDGVTSAIQNQFESVLDYTFNLFDPDAIYAGDHEVCIDPRTESAITITRIDVTLDADPTTELEFSLKFADAFIGFANAAVIDDTATVAGVTAVTGDFGDATVPANKCIYLLIDADPDDNITQASFKVSYTVD